VGQVVLFKGGDVRSGRVCAIKAPWENIPAVHDLLLNILPALLVGDTVVLKAFDVHPAHVLRAVRNHIPGS